MKPETTHLLNRFVEAVMLLTYISEVFYSNLGTLVVLTEGFKDFPESFQVNAVVVPYIMPQPLPSKSFSVCH